MDNEKIGQKIIDGRIVSLDDEKIEKLEELSKDLKKETLLIKDSILNKKID